MSTTTNKIVPLDAFNVIPHVGHVATVYSRSAARIARCVRLSSNGLYLAIAGDSGLLEIFGFETNGLWKRLAMFSAGSAIRALVWHPMKFKSVLIGAANGVVYEITIGLDRHTVNCERMYGFIHLLGFSADGKKLIIAHGNTLSVVHDPFLRQNKLGPTITLLYPRANAVVKSLRDCVIPRGAFFLPDGATVLVAFFGTKGIRAYSLVTSATVWSIPLREYSFVGSCAISPSGDRIAVMNLRDGIDFYSVIHRRYISTAKYTLTSKETSRLIQVVDIVFIDEDTVAVGHSDGYACFVRFGIDGIFSTFKVGGMDSECLASPIHSLCSGSTPYGLSLFAVSADSQFIYVGQFQNYKNIIKSDKIMNSEYATSAKGEQLFITDSTHSSKSAHPIQVNTYVTYKRVWEMILLASLCLMTALIMSRPSCV